MYEEFDFGINEFIFDFEFIAETLIKRQNLLNLNRKVEFFLILGYRLIKDELIKDLGVDFGIEE